LNYCFALLVLVFSPGVFRLAQWAREYYGSYKRFIFEGVRDRESQENKNFMKEGQKKILSGSMCAGSSCFAVWLFLPYL
jgi:hypothetical protein